MIAFRSWNLERFLVTLIYTSNYIQDMVSAQIGKYSRLIYQFGLIKPSSFIYGIAIVQSLYFSFTHRKSLYFIDQGRLDMY